MIRFINIMLIIVLTLSPMYLVAAPSAVNYQGLLTASGGDPVADGSYSVVFTIYSAASGGSILWTETRSVTTTGGSFAVLLGSITPLQESVFSSDGRYLGIKVGTDPEISPRTALVSVPWAHRISTIDGAKGGNVTSKVTISDYVSGQDFVLDVTNTATSDGHAISGVTTGLSGVHFGGYFRAEGTESDSRAVYGDASNSGYYTESVGGYFTSQGGYGQGVHAKAYGHSGIGIYAEGSTNGKAAECIGRVTVSSSGVGLNGSTIYLENQNAGGIAFFCKTTSSSDATAVVSQWGTGDIIRGFNSGGMKFQVTNSGKVVTPVVQITGGSDFAELFDVSGKESIEPGMLVSIDPSKPGQLCVSSSPYDSKVTGIISGAGNVAPGMLMGQEGTIANGEYPIALSGRVYCLADASFGAIQPGDLLTTSGTAGHAMKATERDRAQGAIIGKAMTSLEHGTGLVLVLVSLQ